MPQLDQEVPATEEGEAADQHEQPGEEPEPLRQTDAGLEGRTRGSTGAISLSLPEGQQSCQGLGWPRQDAAPGARPGLSWANATLTPIPCILPPQP